MQCIYKNVITYKLYIRLYIAECNWKIEIVHKQKEKMATNKELLRIGKQFVLDLF